MKQWNWALLFYQGVTGEFWVQCLLASLCPCDLWPFRRTQFTYLGGTVHVQHKWVLFGDHTPSFLPGFGLLHVLKKAAHHAVSRYFCWFNLEEYNGKRERVRVWEGTRNRPDREVFQLKAIFIKIQCVSIKCHLGTRKRLICNYYWNTHLDLLLAWKNN